MQPSAMMKVSMEDDSLVNPEAVQRTNLSIEVSVEWSKYMSKPLYYTSGIVGSN